jgi:hypothetical protein
MFVIKMASCAFINVIMSTIGVDTAVCQSSAVSYQGNAHFFTSLGSSELLPMSTLGSFVSFSFRYTSSVLQISCNDVSSLFDPLASAGVSAH